ncbi:unnamed protein product [Musa banksii]
MISYKRQTLWSLISDGFTYAGTGAELELHYASSQ